MAEKKTKDKLPTEAEMELKMEVTAESFKLLTLNENRVVVGSMNWRLGTLRLT